MEKHKYERVKKVLGKTLIFIWEKTGILFFYLFLVCLLCRFMEKSTRCNPDVLPPQFWGSVADLSLYSRAEQMMVFTHHRPWKSSKVDSGRDMGLADSWGRTVYPGKWGGGDFSREKGKSREANGGGQQQLEHVWGQHPKVWAGFGLALWLGMVVRLLV